MNFDTLIDQCASYSNAHIEDAGVIVSYVDGLCIAQGLHHVMINEIVLCDNGARGIVFDLNEEYCSFFLLHNAPINSGCGVRRTKKLFSIPLSVDLLGRVIDYEGNPLDGLDNFNNDSIEARRPIESNIKGIAERESVTSPLNTGFLTIDTLIPIGKGQRQLLLGNRSTGKTSVVLNTIINQKSSRVVSIYVAIAQKESEVARIKNMLFKEGALKNTIIISAHCGNPAIAHYLAPYVGATIAEYFAHEKHKDVIIMYDDLSNHAIAYREMSLLLKRSPAREAFPGDIFYLHARLLERAGNFIQGGSITAFPVAQLQEDDITAYVPTNLISITDGQLFFDAKLYNNGILPAINTELSVSRVGGAAQPPLVNKLSRGLRLDLAQYHEFAAFAQFGSDLDEESENKIKKGKLLIALLKQTLDMRYSVEDEILILYLFKHYYKKLYEIDSLEHFITWFISYVKITYKNFYKHIGEDTELKDDFRKNIENIIEESLLIFTQS
jgi:F-type H+-transporting ATPase subunit alpha